jgi:hypothetical protein
MPCSRLAHLTDMCSLGLMQVSGDRRTAVDQLTKQVGPHPPACIKLILDWSIHPAPTQVLLMYYKLDSKVLDKPSTESRFENVESRWWGLGT